MYQSTIYQSTIHVPIYEATLKCVKSRGKPLEHFYSNRGSNFSSCYSLFREKTPTWESKSIVLYRAGVPVCIFYGLETRAELPRYSVLQGCQMVYFLTKNPNLGNFWRALNWKRSIYCMAIWNLILAICILYGIFSPFWYIESRKIWQP
jgi:hypothetical protein